MSNKRICSNNSQVFTLIRITFEYKIIVLDLDFSINNKLISKYEECLDLFSPTDIKRANLTILLFVLLVLLFVVVV